MTSLKSRYLAAKTFDEFLAGGPKHTELYRVLRSRATAPDSFAQRIASTGRQWHLLVISEEWCNDAVNLLPWLEAMVKTAPQLDMRFIEHLDLMDQHLTNGTSRAIPVVLVLDDTYHEVGWWGPRPRAMQLWHMSPEAQSLTKEERYKELRARYARDRGMSTMEEVTQLIERAAQSASNVPAAASETA
jgi:hypothetical protein